MPDTTPSRPAMTMREIRDRLGHARPDTTPATDPVRCPGCGHAHHGADVECEASVEHGPKHWHRCLCLARPYASSACPPPMHCQGGSLGYMDIYYLQRGHTVGGPNGRKVTPDVLKLAPWIEGDPLMEAIAAAVWERCATEQTIVVDDPRNIAAVAATTARLVLDTTDQQPDTRPCGPVPDVCDAEAGDPCANHEREQAHSEGEHAFCGNECAVATDQQPETAPACPQCGDTGACNGGPCPLTETAPDDLRDRVAQALIDWAYRSGDRKYTALRRDETVRTNAYSRADAVLSVLPAPTDRATDDRRTLAAALDGLHTLIATSSRDWQTYRADAWIWAVLCGWDCEQAEHDDTCTHGALEETATLHGWSVATVAKARCYRAAVRRMADEAQQPETEVVEDESCGRFVPDTPRAPGLCASCGDARGWHSLEAVGEQQPEAEAGRLPCSLAFLKRPHTPHTWEPQPGMTPVVCPGADTGPQAKAETEEPTL